jgi:hypothetical protein
MRTAVVHGEKAISPTQNSDLVAACAHDSEPAIFEIGDGTQVDRHGRAAAALAGLARSADFHP